MSRFPKNNFKSYCSLFKLRWSRLTGSTLNLALFSYHIELFFYISSISEQSSFKNLKEKQNELFNHSHELSKRLRERDKVFFRNFLAKEGKQRLGTSLEEIKSESFLNSISNLLNNNYLN